MAFGQCGRIRLRAAAGACSAIDRLEATLSKTIEISMSADSYILTFSWPNRPGIVAAVARALFESGGNIQEAHQYDDVETNLFFCPYPVQFRRWRSGRNLSQGV